MILSHILKINTVSVIKMRDRVELRLVLFLYEIAGRQIKTMNTWRRLLLPYFSYVIDFLSFFGT